MRGSVHYKREPIEVNQRYLVHGTSDLTGVILGVNGVLYSEAFSSKSPEDKDFQLLEKLFKDPGQNEQIVGDDFVMDVLLGLKVVPNYCKVNDLPAMNFVD